MKMLMKIGLKFLELNFPKEEDQQLHESFIIKKKAPNEQFVEYAYNGRIDIKNSVNIDYKISSETKTWRLQKCFQLIKYLGRKTRVLYYIN